MVKVTQEDREAAASGYFAWISSAPVLRTKILDGRADDHSMVQAFARHRQSAIAELCEGLGRLLRADIGDPDELIDAESSARALLSKHSPDAPGQHAGTRATESGDGDKR